MLLEDCKAKGKRSEIMFNVLSTATYHWLKHSMEYLITRDMLTPFEYKQELNALPSMDDCKTDLGQIKWGKECIFARDVDNGFNKDKHAKMYNEHLRYLVLREIVKEDKDNKISKTVKVVTYHKNVIVLMEWLNSEKG